jgi:hypothetical protein
MSTRISDKSAQVHTPKIIQTAGSAPSRKSGSVVEVWATTECSLERRNEGARSFETEVGDLNVATPRPRRWKSSEDYVEQSPRLNG